MFGLTFEKLLIIGVIAVFLLGPDRLPHYAAQLARLVRSLRDLASGAKDRMREEMGPEFDDVDWKQLDPRQYDPRRIIREALLEDAPAVGAVGAVAGRSGAASPADAAPSAASRAAVASDSSADRRRRIAAGEAVRPPYDAEAT